MKKIIIFVLSAIMLISCVTFVSADNNSYVYDYADVMTDSEENNLENYILQIKAQYKFDIVVVVAENFQGMTAQQFTDMFYDDGGFGDKYGGVLIALDMENRAWEVSTSPEITNIIRDDEIVYYQSSYVSYLSRGQYYYAFTQFADFCKNEVSYYLNGEDVSDPSYFDHDPSYVRPKTEDDFNNGVEYFLYANKGMLIFSAIVAFVVAGILISSDKKKLTSVRSNNSAASYLVPGSFDLIRSHDVFLFRNVTRVKIETENNGNRGSHSGGHSGGHGGGGGRF